MLIAPAFNERPEISERRMSAHGYPVLVEPEGAAGDLPDAILCHRDRLRERLHAHGALLFRGFQGGGSLEDCERIVDALGGEAMSYVGGTTTRRPLTPRIGTASGERYRGPIPVHQEMAYQDRFPTHLAFFALQPAPRGGETLLAGVRAFRERLPDFVWETFARRGVATRRRLLPRGARQGTWQGRPWDEALLAGSREEAERIMREFGWDFDWIPDGGLDIRQPSLPALRPHPDTGEVVWFNQVHLNHPYMRRTVHAAERRYLRWLLTVVLQAVTRGRNYPTQTRFGDGARIPMRYPRAVQRALDAVTVAVHWQPGDVLLIDNFLMMHGRAPFEGTRLIGACLLNRTLTDFSPEERAACA